VSINSLYKGVPVYVPIVVAAVELFLFAIAVLLVLIYRKRRRVKVPAMATKTTKSDPTYDTPLSHYKANERELTDSKSHEKNSLPALTVGGYTALQPVQPDPLMTSALQLRKSETQINASVCRNAVSISGNRQR
jgi:hypothetical protein